MSTTIGDILLSVAYRRGEDSLPNDANESQRRLLYCAEAYRKVCQANLYWFLEKTGAESSITDKNRYSLPTDFREMLEVRVDNIVRPPLANFQAHNEYNYPSRSISYINYYQDRNYYLDGNEMVFLPAISETPASLSLAITSVGTLATVVSITEHGMQTDDYITISGANESQLNGKFRVTVIDSTSFYITVSTFTGSGTGTIVGQVNNIRYRYFAHPSTITATTDTVLIPDIYTDILVAYVCGRLSQLDGEKGDATDFFAEFEEIKMEINKENLRRGFYGTKVNRNFI
jgi:hypothetical protein